MTASWFQTVPSAEVSLARGGRLRKPLEDQSGAVAKGRSPSGCDPSINKRELVAFEWASGALAGSLAILALTVFSVILYAGNGRWASGIAEILLLVVVLLAAAHYVVWMAAGRMMPCRPGGLLAARGAMVLCSGTALAGGLVIAFQALVAERNPGWGLLSVLLVLVAVTSVYMGWILGLRLRTRSSIAMVLGKWQCVRQLWPGSSSDLQQKRKIGTSTCSIHREFAALRKLLGDVRPALRQGAGGGRQLCGSAGRRGGKFRVTAKGTGRIIFKAWRAVGQRKESWESHHFVKLKDRERVRFVHCVFDPPFEQLPQVVAEVVWPNDVRARVLRSYPYGARVELRRSVAGPATTVHLRVRAVTQHRTQATV